MYLGEGAHDISVVFSKYDSTILGEREDRLVVHELVVVGVLKGFFFRES